MEKIKIFCFLIFILLVSQNVLAENSQYLKAVIDSGDEAKMDWQTIVEPRWQPLSEVGQFEFFWMVRIMVPKETIIDRVASKKSSVGFEKDPTSKNISQILLKMQMNEDDIEIFFKNQESLKFKLSLLREDFFFLTKGCDKSPYDFDFQNLEKAGVPYIAVRCAEDASKQKSWINIFVPAGYGLKGSKKKANINLFSSDVLNDLLKTENLEVTGPNLNDKVVLNVKVKSKTENDSNIIMNSLDDLIQTLSHYRFGFGLADVHVFSAAGARDSSVRPIVLVDLEMRPGKAPISLGLTGSTLLAGVNFQHYITHTETIGHAHYHFSEMEDNWQFELRGYWYMSDGVSKDLDFFFSHNLITGGFKVLKKFKKRSLSAEVFYYPGKNYISRASIFIEENRQVKEKAIGFFVTSTSEKMKLNDRDTGYLNQIEIGGFLNF